MEFEEWFRRELPRLLRLATVLSGSSDVAQDLVQEVVIRVEQRWAKLSGMDHRDAYVRRMLVNEYLSYRRRFSRLVLRATVDPAIRDAPDFTVQGADRAALRRELARLPPRQRAVVVLRYFDDADDATIGRILGCRTGTVRAHASRALQALRIGPLSNDRPENQPRHRDGVRSGPPPSQAAPTNGEEDFRAHRS